MTTYDIDPHAGEAGFDDSAWPIILPTQLEAKRGGGKVSFLWFRTQLTTSTRIGDFALNCLKFSGYTDPAIWQNRCPGP